MAIQIAIIGCGGMANGHLNAYLTIHNTEPGKVELVAMCDEVEDRADNFAERVKEVTGKKPAVFTDTDTMLAKADLDGVDICTSHAHHHINAIKCLNAGVNVMVEKPMGITVKATHAIIAAAKENGKIACNCRKYTTHAEPTYSRMVNERKTDTWRYAYVQCTTRKPS